MVSARNVEKAPGVAPESSLSSRTTASEQNFAKPKQDSALSDSPSPASEQDCALPEHQTDTSAHSQVVPRLYGTSLPADLAEVESAWPYLPEDVKAGILAMVRASGLG
jgi:hypothetical protein